MINKEILMNRNRWTNKLIRTKVDSFLFLKICYYIMKEFNY